MKRNCILIISVMLFALSGYAQTASNNPYQIYSSMKKTISELEWWLVQINLKLGENGYFIYFDDTSNLFKADKFIDTATLVTNPPATIREFLLSQCRLVEAVIGSEIPEFWQVPLFFWPPRPLGKKRVVFLRSLLVR